MVRRSRRPWPVPTPVWAATSRQGRRLHCRVQGRLVGLDQEGDRLRRFRALLPCEVVVTALAHPLCGCRVRAYAFRHVDGVPHLKVELPDGMPGLVAADATDVFGAGPAAAGAGLVLDGAGLRHLRAVVTRLRDGDRAGSSGNGPGEACRWRLGCPVPCGCWCCAVVAGLGPACRACVAWRPFTRWSRCGCRRIRLAGGGGGARVRPGWGSGLARPMAWHLVIAVVHRGVLFAHFPGEIVMRKERNLP